MSLPGFVAEHSVYRSSMPYRAIGALGALDSSTTILPQQQSCLWWLLRTRTACVAVTLWCRDYCGQEPISGWYLCGACFGFWW
jgi:hypothetical protein